MLELILCVLLGIVAGCITGLIPGIHINLIATIVLVNSMFLLAYFPIQYIIVFLISMGIIHSFVDFIPSVLFGVPSSDTALSVLPGHRLVLEGRGYEAIFLSSIGSFLGMIFSLLIIPVLYFFLVNIYDSFFPYIPYSLLFVLFFMVYLEKSWHKKFWATIIILFSSSLGILALNSYFLLESLLVLFSGLFGISSLIFSLGENSRIPSQEFTRKTKLSFSIVKPLSLASSCATICSISPGLGSAQAATIASLFMRNVTSEVFIIILSSINTINFALSILSLYLIDKARNGVVVVISQLHVITFDEMLIFLGIMTFCAIFGFFITLYLGKKCIYVFNLISITKISIGIIIFIFFLVWYFSSWIGLLYLLLSTCLGLLALELEVKRIHLMSILLVPVILVLL